MEEYPKQWGLQAINAEAAWEITQGDENVILAIIDSGVDGAHPEFAGKTFWRALTPSAKMRSTLTQMDTAPTWQASPQTMGGPGAWLESHGRARMSPASGECRRPRQH